MAQREIQNFSTGATRDGDQDKLDFDGFLSPLVLEEYAEYMHRNRLQSDGRIRASDNWQLGIPFHKYMKSLWRHFFGAWRRHRRKTYSISSMKADLCGVLFNTMGYLHELAKYERTHNCTDITVQTADTETQPAV